MPGPDDSPKPFGLRQFVAIYLACAVASLMVGATPSWGPQSSLQGFSAGLFGLLALLAANLGRRSHGPRAAFWWASAAALVLLGLDELFAVHERLPLADAVGGDLLEIALWIGGGAALALVGRVERPSRSAWTGFAAGYAVHTLHLASELGDGALYTLPLPPEALGLVQDLLRLAMLSAYLFAFATLAEDEEVRQEARESREERPRRAA